MIDWTNPEQLVSKYFKVRELIYLPQWNRLANESDGLTTDIQNNLSTLAIKLDIVRAYLNYPINITSGYRPPNYSILVGGFANDPHTQGKAVDFNLEPNMTCDQVKQLLMPCLQSWNLRMEDNGEGSNWVHLDFCPVVHNRFFIP